MQRPLFSDMVFRSAGMSEDCLYLNVWTPAHKAGAKLPVLVYFYGGGFIGGDGSESRYDGASLATRGIVTVTVNYRLDDFGFLALPALAANSPHHAAGNRPNATNHRAIHPPPTPSVALKSSTHWAICVVTMSTPGHPPIVKFHELWKLIPLISSKPAIRTAKACLDVRQCIKKCGLVRQTINVHTHTQIDRRTINK